jgi:hypothetical protein
MLFSTPLHYTKMILNEALSMTLMSRFLNHLELLDGIDLNGFVGRQQSREDALSDNQEGPSGSYISAEMANEHGDAVLRNLLAVGKFLASHQEIHWLGSEKRAAAKKQKVTEINEESQEEEETTPETSTSPSPWAFVVLMDKICKIGRKATRILLISTCLKFYAGILVNCQDLIFASPSSAISSADLESVYLSMLKLVDHVQTFTISRDQVRKKEWRSSLELAKALLERLKLLMGEDLHSVLNLRLVKSMSAAKIARKEEKRQLVLMDPEKAAKMKSSDNQRKYRARKSKSKRT